MGAVQVHLNEDNTKKVKMLAAERGISNPMMVNKIVAEYASLREDLVKISKRLKAFSRRE